MYSQATVCSREEKVPWNRYFLFTFAGVLSGDEFTKTTPSVSACAKRRECEASSLAMVPKVRRWLTNLTCIRRRRYTLLIGSWKAPQNSNRYVKNRTKSLREMYFHLQHNDRAPHPCLMYAPSHDAFVSLQSCR